MDRVKNRAIDLRKELREVDLKTSNVGGVTLAGDNGAALDHQREGPHKELSHGTISPPAMRGLHPANLDTQTLQKLGVILKSPLKPLQVDAHPPQEEKVPILFPERVDLVLGWPYQCDLPEFANPLAASPPGTPNGLHLVEETVLLQNFHSGRDARFEIGVVGERVILKRTFPSLR